MGSVLDERREQSDRGLTDIREALVEALANVQTNNVVVYITGSFGRLEARYPVGSDLDVFFLYMPGDRDARAELPRLVWFQLIAAVIDVARKLDFKPFSRDGEFLKAHNVFHIGNELGSRNEDADNGFTARLLLLLEGRYLVNEALYDDVLLEVIRFYYRDFADKRERFRPYALINDILRYWRTLCLNYEHQRSTKREAAGDDEQAIAEFTASSALDNLKLRYSRLALCFSMIAVLVSEPDGLSQESMRDLCGTVPSHRWALAAGRDASGQAEALVPHILAAYEEFLVLVADEEKILDRLGSQDPRRELRQKAGEFGDLVFELIKHVAVTEEQFRRLVV
jgi:hypothetical protein